MTTATNENSPTPLGRVVATERRPNTPHEFHFWTALDSPVGIGTIVIAGVQTDQGVEVTARHAFALGFFPVVAEDAVGSRTSAAHELGITFLRGTQTDLATVQVIADAWKTDR